MANWNQRYATFPPHLHNYLYAAEKRVLELIVTRPWIKTGLERQVWKDTGVYPSLVGSAIRRLNEYNRCYVGERKRNRLHIVKLTQHQRIPQEFDDQLERIDTHLQSVANHSDTLEVLVNLALFLIREDITFEVYVKPDHYIDGYQFDSFIQYKGVPVGINVKNKTGDISPSNVYEYLENCNNCLIRSSMIVTWMNDLAQKQLIAAQGFFSNLCRIYTLEAYSEIIDDFNDNGFKNLVTTLDFNQWGWNDATIAKKWLNQKHNEGKKEEIIDKARNIFKGKYKIEELTHLIQKVKGTFIYTLLKIHTEEIRRAEKDLSRFGLRSLTERDNQRLNLTPNVYLNMIFNGGIPRKIEEITAGFKNHGYLKKQSIETREGIIEGTLNFLRDYKVVKKQGTKWIVTDAKTPYIDKSDIF